MAILGGAAITAAGTVAASSLSKKGGGGGGGGGNPYIEFVSPGLNVNTVSGTRGDMLKLVRGGQTTDALARLNSLTGGAVRDLRGLRGLVQPGVGALTKARLGAIENNRLRSIGNLSENLQRRRVLGSSFAQDALSRAEAEFAQQEGLARAEGFLQEFGLTQGLVLQELQTAMAPVLQELEQLNFETEAAVSLSGGIMNAASANNATAAKMAMMQAQLDFDRSSAMGQFFSPIGDALGKKLFGDDTSMYDLMTNGGFTGEGGFVIGNSGGANLAGGSFFGN